MKKTQLLKRLRAPFVRDELQQFRNGFRSASQAAAELQVSKRKLYHLFHSYLKAVGQRKAQQWSPRLSGGARRSVWPKSVPDLVVRLLQAKTPCSYSLVASEYLRRLRHKVDRATVRRFAPHPNLAPQRRPRRRPPVRRWQTQKAGQLWQDDASPHRWVVGQNEQPSLLHLMDDHSRVIVAADLYERETLLAHLDFLSQALQATGCPCASRSISTASSSLICPAAIPSWPRACAFTVSPGVLPNSSGQRKKLVIYNKRNFDRPQKCNFECTTTVPHLPLPTARSCAIMAARSNRSVAQPGRALGLGASLIGFS